mmetsp:Transcript_95535/g.275259  ORF Transcript_95535/g.275259 Transcript_95535/m.275259 type:complete len:278 (+) Transcript_95535:2078-2911(+)
MAAVRAASSAPTMIRVLNSRTLAVFSSSSRRFSAASPSKISLIMAKGTTTFFSPSSSWTCAVRPSVSSSSSESAPQSSICTTVPGFHSPLTFTSTFASFWIPVDSLSAPVAFPGTGANRGGLRRNTMVVVCSSKAFMLSRFSPSSSLRASLCKAKLRDMGASSSGRALIWWLSSDRCSSSISAFAIFSWAAEPTMYAVVPMYSRTHPVTAASFLRMLPPLPTSFGTLFSSNFMTTRATSSSDSSVGRSGSFATNSASFLSMSLRMRISVSSRCRSVP